MMNISPDPGKAFDCRENAERMIECVFLPNGAFGHTYELEETRFASRLRVPSVFRVLVKDRAGGFVGYARIAEHSGVSGGGMTHHSPPASPPCYLGFETVRKCPNQCKGECGYKPRPAACLAPDRSHCPEGCCEPSEGR